MASPIDIESKDQKIEGLIHDLEDALKSKDDLKNECARLQRAMQAFTISHPPTDAIQQRLPLIQTFFQTADAENSTVPGHGRQTFVVPSRAPARSHRSTPFYRRANDTAYEKQYMPTEHPITESIERSNLYDSNVERGLGYAVPEAEPAPPRALSYKPIEEQYSDEDERESTPEDVVESIERPDLFGNFADGSSGIRSSGPDSLRDAEGRSETTPVDESTEESTLGSGSRHDAGDGKGPEGERRPGVAGIGAPEAVNRKRNAARAGLDAE